MSKIKLTVNYAGLSEPIFKFESELDKSNFNEMYDVEYVCDALESTLLLTRDEISVYHSIRDESYDSFNISDNWFSTKPINYRDNDDVFDWRELPTIDEKVKAKYEREFPGDQTRQVVAYAIDSGLIDENGLVDTWGM